MAKEGRHHHSKHTAREPRNVVPGYRINTWNLYILAPVFVSIIIPTSILALGLSSTRVLILPCLCCSCFVLLLLCSGSSLSC
jgi:hypothetical protein